MDTDRQRIFVVLLSEETF